MRGSSVSRSRLWKCSRTERTTRPETAGATSTAAATTASRSSWPAATRSRRSRARNSLPGADFSSFTAPVTSYASSSCSTRLSKERASFSPRATANTSAACGQRGYSCGWRRSPRRLKGSRCACTSASFAGFAATTASRPASSPRRTGRGSGRNRVGSWSVTSPPDRAQARRSTSVTVSSRRSAPTPRRASLTTARFSRTGIDSGWGPAAHRPARVPRSRRWSSLRGVVLPAKAR